MSQPYAAFELITKVTGKVQATVVEEIHAAEQRVLGELSNRGSVPSISWLFEVAEALKSLIEAREETLLRAAVKALKAKPPMILDNGTPIQIANFLMDDLGQYYNHASQTLRRLESKLVGYLDGLPPSLTEHEKNARRRITGEMEMLMAEIEIERRPALTQKHVSRTVHRHSVTNIGYPATVFRVMIASPSDVKKEREIAQEVIAEWNALHSKDRAIVLLPLLWERDSTPLQGNRPQALINAQVLEKADVLVAIFWSRIGSPTGAAVSGTVEEFSEHLKGRKPALLYFSTVPTSPAQIDPEQLVALNRFKHEAGANGLYETFGTSDEFRRKFSHHLTKMVVENPLFASAQEWSPGGLAETEKFNLIGAMADDLEVQLAILMHDKSVEIPRSCHYVYERSNGDSGSGNLHSLARSSSRLEGSGVVRISGGGEYIALTDEGHRFAEWAIRKGRRCAFFWTPAGSWGNVMPGGSGEKSLQEKLSRAGNNSVR